MPDFDNAGPAHPQTGFTVDRRPGGTAVIAVHCEIDALTIPTLGQLLNHEIDTGRTNLLIDFSECEFMGSAGLAALVDTRDRAQESGTTFILVGLNRTLTRAFAATGLTALFCILPTLDSAYAQLR